MGRTASANDQLVQHCVNKAVDIALLQEPYTHRDRLTGFEANPIRTFLSRPTLRQGNNCNVYGAAIVVFNPTIRALARPDLCTEHIVTVTIDVSQGTQISLISSYFKYRIATMTHTTTLDNILSKIEHDYIIGMDANAFSTSWYCHTTDRRGQIVEEFIANHNLEIQNVESLYTTFAGPRGNSNIDLTIATSVLSESVGEWKVIPSVTTSDHNVIMYELSLNNIMLATPLERRFDVAKADWVLFNESLALQDIVAGNYTPDINEWRRG